MPISIEMLVAHRQAEPDRLVLEQAAFRAPSPER
jgi:hypothetical protein